MATSEKSGRPDGKRASRPLLTELSSYADAQRHFSREKLWELFDGDAGRLNIGHECLDRHPGENVALRIVGAEGEEVSCTFRELSELSSRFAHRLQALGVGQGERVAIMLEPSLSFYATLFGAMKAGAVAVPLFTLFGPEGLRLRLEDCRPRVLVTESSLAHLAQGYSEIEVIEAGRAFLDGLGAHPAEFSPRTAGDDMAMYQYTSGTTRALPEAVKHPHRAIVTVMIAALYGTGVRPGDVFFCPSSPAWGHGLWHGTLAPLALGVSITAWAGAFDAERMLQVLEAHGITNFSAAATHYRMLKNSGLAGRYRFRVEKLSFTGEPMDSGTAEFAEAAFGKAVCSMYGTTELGVILGNYPGAPDLEVKPGALGKPVPGVELEIHDARGRPCPPGVTGELMVRRRGRWIPTRDLAQSDEEGYYYHGGRADDVIISAGWTMSAVEIENVLLKHEDVAEAAVIGVPDELRGQVVKAFIVSERPGSDEFAGELQAFTRAQLSRHEYPRLVEFAAGLPKTPAGKINRKALREREAEHPESPDGTRKEKRKEESS